MGHGDDDAEPEHDPDEPADEEASDEEEPGEDEPDARESDEEPAPPRVSNVVRGGAAHSIFQIGSMRDLHVAEVTGTPTELGSGAGRRPPLLVGREEPLKAALTTSNPVCAVIGPGGVGKTELVLEVAHRLYEEQEYRGGLLFLDCDGYRRENGLSQATSSLLALLRVRDAPQTDAAAVNRLQQRYAEFAAAGLPLLLVLDNVGPALDPEPLLPSSRSHRTLITSRDERVPRDVALIRLPELTSEAAVGMLRAELERAAPADPRAGDTDGLRTIADLCGRLPLALSVVGPLLSMSPRRRLSAVAEQLASPQRLTVLRTVRPVLELSLTSLLESPEESDRAAAALFTMLGCAPEIEFSDRAAAALLGEADPARARALLDRLCAAHLLEPGMHSEQVRFLGLTGDYAAALFEELPTHRDGPEREPGRADLLVRLAEHAAATIEADLSTMDSSGGREEVSRAFRDLHAGHDALSLVATRAVETAEREPESSRAGSPRRRLLSAARRIAVSLVVLCERTERDRESLAASRLLLRATTLLGDRRGELDAFLAMCRGLLALNAEADAARCLHEASTLTRQLDGYPTEFMRTFAELACRMGKLEASAAEYMRLLGEYRTCADVEGQLAALNGLAHIAFLRDDLPAAVRGNEAVQRLAAEHGCARHAEHALHELGRCHARLGDAEQAARCHLDAKRSAETRGSPDGVALASHRLGDLHSAEGRIPDALECYAECERTYRDAGDHRRADRTAERIRALRGAPEEPDAPTPVAEPGPVAPPPPASPPKRDPRSVARSLQDMIVLLAALTGAQVAAQLRSSANPDVPPAPWAWWAVAVLLVALAVARRYAYRFTRVRLPLWSWALDLLAYGASAVHFTLVLIGNVPLGEVALFGGVYLFGGAAALYVHHRRRRRRGRGAASSSRDRAVR